MDNQILRGVADARALALGVHRQNPRRFGVGGLVDEDGANALVVLDDGDCRVLHDVPNQPLAASGDYAMHIFVELEKLAECGAVARGNDLHAVGVQPRVGECPRNQLGKRDVRAERLAAAAQDCRVAAFKAQRGAVDCHIRSAFVDDSDDADWGADFRNFDAVRAGRRFDYLAHGVGEFADLADALGYPRDFLRVERKAFEHGL